MAENSNIGWTDNTFNPVRGCAKVSEGCKNCYAETLSKRNPAVLGEWGPGKPRVLAAEAQWKMPLKWNRIAEKGDFQEVRLFGGRDGAVYRGSKADLHKKIAQLEVPDHEVEWSGPVRPRVFCASLADWLDEEWPVEWLARLLTLIHQTPALDWLLLTKRIENWKPRIEAALDYLTGLLYSDVDVPLKLDRWLKGRPWSNIWMGTTVENQAMAEKRLPHLLSIPAKVRFLSCEPLLGQLDLCEVDWLPSVMKRERQPDDVMCHMNVLTGYLAGPDEVGKAKVDWVIAGGESGPGARPMHPDWARSLRSQCAEAGVPYFFKQWGNWAPLEEVVTENVLVTKELPGKVVCLEGEWMVNVGKSAAGEYLDGEICQAFPEVERGSR